MCGLPASFLFAIVSRLVDRETRVSSEGMNIPPLANRAVPKVERAVETLAI
jgi:hypothetical protein